MKIYVICAVRNAPQEYVSRIREQIQRAREQGHVVHFPPDDAPQEDPTGSAICAVHLSAMKQCDQVWVYWDVESKGSHFDLGMAYALGKSIVPIECKHHDGDEKSYWKVINAL